MIAAWMAYATLVTALAAAAALAAERALRLSGRATRWAWAGALLLACLAPLAATRRVAEPAARPASAAPVPAGSAALSMRAAPSMSASMLSIPATIAVGAGSPLASLDRPLLALWVAGSVAWCIVLVVSGISISRRRARWTSAVVDGVPVLVSHSTGPALVGVIAPDIVIPSWMLEASPEHRALAVAHEREHARARDPMLLIAGSLALAAMPWNAALWLAVSRLRLAVESDCDQRVLRAHPDVRAYGSLLVDVSERALPGMLQLVSLAESPSVLARRLSLMIARRPRFAALRAVGAAFLSVLLVAVACEAPRPTTVSTRAQVVAGTARRAVRLSNGDSVAPIPDSTLLSYVAEYFPDALTRAMGSKPTLWFVADAEGRVQRIAVGSELLEDGLDMDDVSRRFDGVPAALVSSVQWSALSHLSNGPDSLIVIWAQLRPGAAVRRDLTPSPRRAPAQARTPSTTPVQALTPRGALVTVGADSTPEPPAVADSVILRAVTKHFPNALTGGMGPRPMLWFLGDRDDHVMRSASGRQGLEMVDGEASVTWGGVVKMLPGTPASMHRRGDVMQLDPIVTGSDTVIVVWARLWGDAPAH